MSKIAQDTTKAGLGCRCGACLGGVLRGIAHRQRECALAHISLYGRIWPYMALSKKLRFVEISAQPALGASTCRGIHRQIKAGWGTWREAGCQLRDTGMWCMVMIVGLDLAGTINTVISD